MNKKPLVSVIMNCHNGELYLKKSIKSIINQSYKNWELIFWNNNSTDRSKEIFLSFKDKRMKYFENFETINLYRARNLAVNVSKGELICFLDTDDWWLKNKLKKQIEYFNKINNLKFIYTNFYIFDQKLKKKKIALKKILPKGKITQYLLNNYIIGILTVMMKRSLFKKQKFNNNYNIIGDFDFFLNLSLNNNMYSLQLPLAFYRHHSKNYTKIKRSLYNKELKLWYKLNKNKYESLGFSLIKIKVLYFKNKIKNILESFSFS